MKQYLDLLRHVMEKGIDRPDRTGTGTRSVFGYQIRFDLREGFPLVTTKKVNIKAVIHELLWFLRGETNIKSLNAVGVHIWDEWADKDGELGPVYGKQWRHWEHSDCDGSHIDQIKRVLEEIAKTPYSRRIIVSAWNPSQVDEMALPPCHTLFQFYVSKDGGLSCHLYARSIDSFLGLPFNIASYALLTKMFAHVCHLYAKELIISFGDVHIYRNHFEQVKEQLSRTPRPLPELIIHAKEVPLCDGFTYEDFELIGYNPWPAIKGEISV